MKRGHSVLKGVTVISLLAFSRIQFAIGHGRLMEPPNRSSLWRVKEFEAYEPEENYDDNQLWCGGMGSQYNLSGGKCGACGDSYADKRPRENENGGKYGRGIITRTYSPGQTIPVGVELTVNHLGYFVFSLCPIQLVPGGPITLEEEECFNENILPLADGTGSKYVINSTNAGYFNSTLKLPKTVTCYLCSIRWHYRAGNRWNYYENKTGALGVGDQEIFRGCSDVRIGSFPEVPRPTPHPPILTSTPSKISASKITTIKAAASKITTTKIPAFSTTTAKIPSTSITAASTPESIILSSTTPKTDTNSTPSNRPNHFPTQRPPPTTSTGAAILTAAPTISPTTKAPPIPTSNNGSNNHPHPIMRPPHSNTIMLSKLIDKSVSNNNSL